MLLPSPFYTISLSILFVMLLLSLVSSYRIKKRVRNSMGAGGSGDFSIDFIVQEPDRYTTCNLMTIIYILMNIGLWWSFGMPLWDTTITNFFFESDFILALLFFIIIFAGIPIVFTLRYAGEYFIVNAEGIERHELYLRPYRIKWAETIKVSPSGNEGIVNGINIEDEEEEFTLLEKMANIERLYKVIMERVPSKSIDNQATDYFIHYQNRRPEEKAKRRLWKNPTILLGIGMFFFSFIYLGIMALFLPGPQGPVIGLSVFAVFVVLIVGGAIIAIYGLDKSRKSEMPKQE